MSDLLDSINAPLTTPVFSDRNVAPTNNDLVGSVSLTLADAIGEQCRKFTDEVINTVLDNLASRNQDNAEVIWKQIYYGKVAEFGVAALIAHRGYPVNSPDINVYSATKKSWMADLRILKEPFTWIHVKSMFKESAEKFGMSWTLQNSGNGQGHTDREILKADPKQALALAYVDGLRVTVAGIVSCGLIGAELPLRDPHSSKLVGIKKVIYNDDLQKLPEKFTFFREVRHE